MNKLDFLRMMESGTQIDRQMIGELNDLISIFPYFQSAHMLLLKALRDSSDVRFENQLRNSAIHVGDREILYYFLKNEALEEGISQDISEVKVISLPREVDSQQTVIETGKNSEEIISEIEKSSGEKDSEDQYRTGEDNFCRSILISTELDDEEYEHSIFVINEESPPPEEKIFFMDPGFSIPEESDLLELDVDNYASKKLVEVVEVQPHEEVNEKESRKQLQADLIEKFITANPRIEPQKEKSDQPFEDISKPFVEERESFITETLARIYINQGYYSKAMDIYEKLSLKFPEKSSYFATQIERVKELIKQC